MSYLFTSESVSEGHPDKVADAISDAVLDLVMTHQDPSMRCACETMVTTDNVIVAGEYKGLVLHPEEIEAAVRKTVKHIGYEQDGFNWHTLRVTNLLHSQSSDIALGTDNFGAGDQGLMFGYATDETDNYMPAALYWSHKILQKLAELRHTVDFAWLGPDAKAQVTFEYDEANRPRHIRKVVCSTQHRDHVPINIVRAVVEDIITELLPPEFIEPGITEFYINPTGRFVIGGPDGDCGLTGRKIIVDTYGGYAPHGGGAFSGKDPTKVDRSAAYMMRYIAKNIVASGRAPWATCQVSYAIGVADPMSFYVETENSDLSRELTTWVARHVDLTPKGIIDRFNLFRPIYSSTTNYGHFGKPDLPWEKVDLF